MAESSSYKVRSAEWSPAQVERNLAALHGKRRARKQRRRVLLAAPLLAAAAAALWFVMPSAEAPAPTESIAKTEGAAGLDSPKPSVDSVLSADGDSLHSGIRTVSFRDGSEAALKTAGSQLHVREVSSSSIQVDLAEGEAQFSITPDPERRFVVHARELLITVLGTEFTVRHEAARSWVGVEKGKVSVRKGEDETILTAGEASWFGGDSSNEVPAPSEEQDTEESPRALFAKHHAKADYAAAYQVLSRSPQIIGESAQDLLRAADAARYSGHPAEATRYLERVPPTDPAAPSAQFTLGRLYLHQLGSPTQAAEAFSLVRKLAPGGPLAEDALFREIEARSRAGQSGQAKSLARLYIKRYPASARREKVEKWGELP